MKIFVSVLVACSAVTAYLVWRIFGLMPDPSRTHRGMLLAMPLICITSGQLVGLAWSAFHGLKTGPWSLVIANVFLATMLVMLIF